MGWAAEKSSKKGVNRKEICFLKLDGLGKIQGHAPRSEYVHLHQDIGRSHTRGPSSRHAAASAFKVCARE